MSKVTIKRDNNGRAVTPPRRVIRNHSHLSQMRLPEPMHRRISSESHAYHYLDWLLKFTPKTDIMQRPYEPHLDLPVHRQLVKLAACIKPETPQQRYFGQITAALYPQQVRANGIYTTDDLGFAHLSVDSHAFGAAADDGHFKIELLTNSTDNAPVNHHLWVFDADGKLVMTLEPHDDVSLFRSLMEELTGMPLPEDHSVIEA